jgi:hypothetical protein
MGSSADHLPQQSQTGFLGDRSGTTLLTRFCDAAVLFRFGRSVMPNSLDTYRTVART